MTTVKNEAESNNANTVLAPVFNNMELVLKIIKKYGRKNTSPKGMYHCLIPIKDKFKKWDIVKNKGNTITKGAYYVIVGYLKDADFYNNGHKNINDTKNGYIVLRLYDLSVETALIKDWLEPCGINLVASLNGC
jgi:hypothetical protein